MPLLHFLRLHKEKILFLSILLIGSVLRLYRLPQTMQFLGDQGRDALIARGILMERDPAFIGPVTSVGNMYLGPFYYYFMVLPLMLTYPSPIGPAYAVAIVGIMTLALLYILGREMIGKTAAMISMVLYAVSPVVIANVRFSWNPNIVPFFSLLAIWAVWKTTQRNYTYWIVIGICAAILFQLHYIALILIGCIGLVWLIQLGMQIKRKKIEWSFIQSSAIAVAIFIVSLAPLLLFDTRHDWLNTRAFLQFFHPQGDSQSHFRKLSDIGGVLIAYISMMARVMTEFFGIVAKNLPQKIICISIFLYVLMRSLFNREKSQVRKAKLILFAFLCISLVFLSLYSSSVFDHYLGFVFPLVFLSLGIVCTTLWRSIFLKPLAVFLIGAFIYTSFLQYPGTQALGSTIFLFDRSSQEIANHIPEGDTFNLLSYSPTRDLQAMNYRYFLTTMGKKPASPDDWTTFHRLIIIDEEHRSNPLDEEQYVIKIWPNRTIVDHFLIPDGPDIYILER